jgi:F-type H+-transporting ATPase subunit gamma
MTTRRELDTRLRTLDELAEILSSLKTLALAETRKLTRLQACQAGVADAVERTAADFFRYYRNIPALDGQTAVVVAVGSERGFVGDFNKRIIAAWPREARMLAVGQRLYNQCQGDARLAGWLEGAVVAAEVEPTLDRLIESINELNESQGRLRIGAIHNMPGEADVRLAPIFPPFRGRDCVPAAGYPPRLYLKPSEFLRELLKHYLFATFRAVLLDSLLAENEARMQHLENAVRRLEEQQASLTRHRQLLRQEEITQEIEMILLSAEVVGIDVDR